MGLFVIRARFVGALPTEETFRRELLAELGDVPGLEGFDIDGNVVAIRTMMDAITYPYAVKVLLRLGGTYLDPFTLQPREPNLPAFVERRWHAWSIGTRTWIGLRALAGLLATVVPNQRVL